MGNTFLSPDSPTSPTSGTLPIAIDDLTVTLSDVLFDSATAGGIDVRGCPADS